MDGLGSTRYMNDWAPFFYLVDQTFQGSGQSMFLMRALLVSHSLTVKISVRQLETYLPAVVLEHIGQVIGIEIDTCWSNTNREAVKRRMDLSSAQVG